MFGSDHQDLCSVVFCPRLHLFCSFLCPFCHPSTCLQTLMSISPSCLHCCQTPVVDRMKYPPELRCRLLCLRCKHHMGPGLQLTNPLIHLIDCGFSKRGSCLVNVRPVQQLPTVRFCFGDAVFSLCVAKNIIVENIVYTTRVYWHSRDGSPGQPFQLLFFGGNQQRGKKTSYHCLTCETQTAAGLSLLVQIKKYFDITSVMVAFLLQSSP